MTRRERLADWISGGALTRIAKCAFQFQALAVNRRVDRDKAEEALRNIAAMETPGANATVRRMAATAREALK